ncbi:hypothetical protein [Ekhidna sp.]
MINRAYRIAQILSIDIVIGAVILLRFFCVQMDVKVGWPVYILLGITVWLIYTTDHLNDAEKAKKSVRDRYVFHRNHRKKLLFVAIILLIILFVLVFFIPVVIMIGGIFLGGFSFLYLIIQHKLSNFFFKEFYVSMVYTSGILMVPFSMSGSIRYEYLILLFLLTFLNLIIFSWYEKDADLKDGFKSIATQSRRSFLERLIFIVVSFGLGISILDSNVVALYFILGFLVYGLMVIYSSWFKKSFRYRFVGDGVFLMPMLLEWL